MDNELFYVDKTTGTFADELVAAGMAHFLDRLLQMMGVSMPEIVLTDCGPCFEIACSPAVSREYLAEFAEFVPGAPLIRTVKNAAKLPADLPQSPAVLVDYEAEREKRNAYFEARQSLSKTAQRAELLGVDDVETLALPSPPHPDWELFRALNPAGLIGYNSLMEQWYEARHASGKVAMILLDFLAQSPNDVDAARAAWNALAKADALPGSADASASQLFNPAQGKGINKAKPNSAGLGNLKNFWLLEWLKAIGFYQVAFTRALKGSKDRKTYVLAPGRLRWETHRKVKENFQHKMRFAETAVRSDILTVLRYLDALLEYVIEAQADEAEYDELDVLLAEEGARPGDFTRGFHVTFYKDMGNAVVTMNQAFLNLPGWVILRQAADVALYQQILAEHEQVVRPLQENHGDELDLLTAYRDFIVADNLDPFFDFTTAYSHYLIREGEKSGFPPRKFTTDNLRRLIVNSEPKYQDILDSPGFQNIAYAIRQSTVIAQWRKKEGDRRYDVRYGLGQELSRKSQYKHEFIAALSDFLHKYNAENAQVMENRPGPYRRSIRTDDIEEIVRLIDAHGSDLVCKLLIAYGYAREPRLGQEGGTEESRETTES